MAIVQVSMMDGRLFDTLEFVARRVRGSDTPFGGVQLILSGDFHQVGLNSGFASLLTLVYTSC